MRHLTALGLQLQRLLDGLLVLGLLTMIVLVFVNVVLRYGFNSGISVTVELSRYLFVWTIFIGAVIALQHNQHLAVATFIDKLPLIPQTALRIIGLLMMLGCTLMLAVGGYKQTVLNWDNLSPISEIPRGISYLAGFIAGVLMSLQLICRLLAPFFVADGNAHERPKETQP